MKSSEKVVEDPLGAATDPEATWARGVAPVHKEEQSRRGERAREGRAVPWCRASEPAVVALLRAGRCKLTEPGPPGGCLTADSVLVT